MFKHKIELITTADIMDFVRIATEESGAVRLIETRPQKYEHRDQSSSANR